MSSEERVSFTWPHQNCSVAVQTGAKFPRHDRSRIQIAERIFHFVLPNGVGYPTAPPSPIMDDYYEGQPYGYPPTPDRSQSPIIYGSDSDELRSDVDEYGYPYDDDDMDVEGSAYGSANAGPSNPPPPALDENGQPIKRKRGRPKKQRTAEQIAAMELERQRRLDPTIPRRPRGRPPKQKKEENTQDLLHSPQTEQTQLPTTQPPQQTSQQPPQPQTRPLPVLMPAQLQPIPYASARSHAPDIPVPPLVPPDSSLPPSQQQQVPSAPRPVIPLGGLDENGKPRLSKKEQADLRKAQKQAEKEEKQRIKEAEKKAKEEAKAAAKEAKAREAAEKKRKDEERKRAAAEEAKRAAEERHKAIEREKAEKERNKAASAAAAAELKAKTMAEAQARGKAEAEARAAREADNKARLGGTAGNEIKIRPAPAPQVNIPVQQAQPIVKRPAQPKQPSQQQTQHQQSPAPKPFTPTNQFQGKPEKPPYSYPALIAQAIWSAPNRQAPLQHIHMWIPDKYPFFRDPAHAQILAQAIKQNLAVNRAFVNIPLPSGVALWAIEPEQAKLFDGNTFLPPPNAQPLPYASAPPPPQPQPFYQQQQSPYPQQPQYPQQQQQPIQHMQMQAQQPQMVSMQQQQPMYGSPAPPSMPMMSPSIQAPVQRPMNGMAASVSPAPAQMPAAMPSLPVQPSIAPQAYTQPTTSPAPVAPPSASPAPPQLAPAPATSSSSSKMPILIARPSASYPKPAPPTSAAANDPSSMLDPEGYPPIAIHEGKMYLSPTVFSSLTAQQLSNLQSIETKQALNILQAFVVNYFKTELKKRKKAEKAALKGAMGAGTGAGASGTPMSASPSPAPSGLKRHAADDPMGGNEAKVQKVS